MTGPLCRPLVVPVMSADEARRLDHIDVRGMGYGGPGLARLPGAGPTSRGGVSCHLQLEKYMFQFDELPMKFPGEAMVVLLYAFSMASDSVDSSLNATAGPPLP